MRSTSRLARRTMAALAAAGAAFALSTTTAQAAPATVDHGRIIFPTVTFDDPDVCASYGFVVHATLDEELLWHFRLDGAGNFQSGFAHHQLHFVITANGRTLQENDTYNNTFNPDGTSTASGLYAHIWGDDGKVLLDAGKVVYDASGDPVIVRGPHPQLLGASFCPALA